MKPLLQSREDTNPKTFIRRANRVTLGAVAPADIAERIGASRPSTGNYRRRLLDAEMIVEAGYGNVDYALPYMREYLREQATSTDLEWVTENGAD